MSRTRLVIVLLSAAIVGLAFLLLLVGTVHIPAGEVLRILGGEPSERSAWNFIVWESRVPLIATAALAGAALAVSGLLLQTSFGNVLADPSILGISTGSSLGVAVVMLAFGGVIGSAAMGYVATLLGALLGALLIMAILLAFSVAVKNSTMLLIVGILISYLASSAISLLNFAATQEGVHSFVVWGLGNFSGVTLRQLPVYASVVAVGLIASLLLIKPLNALLLGRRYAENLGVNIRLTRNLLLLITGVLTAVVTAFCGPIGFVGLVVPHIARLILRTSDHFRLIPATMLTGAAIALLCTLVSVLPSSGTIPINAITPIIGVPVIVYIILNRRKIFYFN